MSLVGSNPAAIKVGARLFSLDHGWPIRPLLLLNCLGKLAAVAVFPFHTTAAFLLFFVPDLALAYHILAPRGQGLGRVFTRFETEQRQVWLTIDDGPDPRDTPRVLELLDSHGARATFFVIGERAQRYPELIEEILRRGHEIGNHTHSHPLASFWCAGPRRVRAEIEQCTAAVGKAKEGLRWFRPPAGIKSVFLHQEVAHCGLACVGWSARGIDGVHHDPEVVVARIIRSLHPGAILLMHEGQSLPDQLRLVALTRLLEVLTAKGYSFTIPRPEMLR